MTTTLIRQCDQCLHRYTNPTGGWGVLTLEDTGSKRDLCPRCIAANAGWSNPVVIGTAKRALDFAERI